MNDDLRDLEIIRRMMLQPSAGHIGVCRSSNDADDKDALVFRVGTVADSALSICITRALMHMRKRSAPDTVSIPAYIINPRAIVRGLRT